MSICKFTVTPLQYTSTELVTRLIMQLASFVMRNRPPSIKAVVIAYKLHIKSRAFDSAHIKHKQHFTPTALLANSKYTANTALAFPSSWRVLQTFMKNMFYNYTFGRAIVQQQLKKIHQNLPFLLTGFMKSFSIMLVEFSFRRLSRPQTEQIFKALFASTRYFVFLFTDKL